MQNKIRKIHFIGVGGSGMSGIAEVLLNQGFSIQGTDIEESIATKRLSNQGQKFLPIIMLITLLELMYVLFPAQ